MFSFRTYIRPLKVLEERTKVMQRLLAAFTALPDEVVSSWTWIQDSFSDCCTVQHQMPVGSFRRSLG